MLTTNLSIHFLRLYLSSPTAPLPSPSAGCHAVPFINDTQFLYHLRVTIMCPAFPALHAPASPKTPNSKLRYIFILVFFFYFFVGRGEGGWGGLQCTEAHSLSSLAGHNLLCEKSYSRDLFASECRQKNRNQQQNWNWTPNPSQKSWTIRTDDSLDWSGVDAAR